MDLEGTAASVPGGDVTVSAVVFDFDGLILDTETSIFASWSHVFAEHGCAPLTVEEWSAQIGTVGGIDLVALFRSRLGDGVDVDVDALQTRRRAHRDALIEHEVVRPGVPQWIADARARGLPLAVASSSEYEWVDAHLRRLGLRDAFGHLACHGPELAAKPDPATYLDACRALGVAPEHALAIEDSPHGIAAARAAGLRVVAVPNSVTAQLDLSAADLVVESLAEVSLADVCARVSA
jgi:HAD superfamily hydrolase (TIGR01509 family)